MNLTKIKPVYLYLLSVIILPSSIVFEEERSYLYYTCLVIGFSLFLLAIIKYLREK